MRDAFLALTKSQRKLLVFIADQPPDCRASARQLSEFLALSLRTVKSALGLLREQGFISSDCTSRSLAASHRVLVDLPSLLKVPASLPVPGAISQTGAVEKGGANPQGGAILHDRGGAISQVSTGSLYRERARLPVTCVEELETLVGVCRAREAPTEENPEPLKGSEFELLLMIEQWFGPVDERLRLKILSLPERFHTTALSITQFWEWKWLQAKGQHKLIYRASSLIQWTEEGDLESWLGRAVRKPPVRAGVPRVIEPQWSDADDLPADPLFSQELVKRASAQVGGMR